jgi:hypothetical protein
MARLGAQLAQHLDLRVAVHDGQVPHVDAVLARLLRVSAQRLSTTKAGSTQPVVSISGTSNHGASPALPCQTRISP